VKVQVAVEGLGVEAAREVGEVEKRLDFAREGDALPVVVDVELLDAEGGRGRG
jgi:hypothetical protein